MVAKGWDYGDKSMGRAQPWRRQAMPPPIGAMP